MRVRCVLFARDRRRVIMRSEIPLGREVRLEAMSFRMAEPTPETRGSDCFATPEEGVACSHFLHTACICPSGFAECSYGNVVPGQLVANDCCHALRMAVSVHEGPHIPGTEIDFGFVCLLFCLFVFRPQRWMSSQPR